MRFVDFWSTHSAGYRVQYLNYVQTHLLAIEEANRQAAWSRHQSEQAAAAAAAQQQA